MKYEKIEAAVFKSRPNRFIAHVETERGMEVCHVKNTGRCRELLVPDARIWVQRNVNPARKTALDLIAVQKGDLLINMDSQIPNRVAEEWIRSGHFAIWRSDGERHVFSRETVIRPETRYGDSRIDLYLEDGDVRMFLEIKGVTLEEDGVARFPDAPTERGVKHLQELTKAAKEGYHCTIAFVIQMNGIHRVFPNEATVGKEDLEEMGTAMTLDLLEDGTGTMDYDGTVYDLTWDDSSITMEDVTDFYTLEDGVLMLANADTEMVFERPGSVAAVTAPDEEEGEQTASSTAASIEDSWTVVPLASAQELVPYSCTEFSMNIPEGWSVKSSAMYTGMFHAIHVFDPENPVNQIFFMLKMEPLFSDENSRAMMALSSDLFGKCPILTNVSTQGVFEIFPQFADAMNATADYADIQTPYIADFSVTESFESTQGMSSVAISPSILRADFTQNGTTGEGMFTADVVPFAMGTGMGYYSVYNLTVLSAEKGSFQDWQPTLNKVLSSLNYTPEFQSFAMSQSNQAASTSQSLSQSASEMSDSIMSSWENRNRSQDIMSQKQSDATLGYERIVDTETGNIYKIDNGFTDWYDGSRYKSITDDQYTDSVEAVIHWK